MKANLSENQSGSLKVCSLSIKQADNFCVKETCLEIRPFLDLVVSLQALLTVDYELSIRQQ